MRRVRARLKARQQLKGMLLRHGRGYNGKTSWSAAHERYLFPARIPRPLQVRSKTQPRVLREIAWRAQLRLCQRYRRLRARGLHHNKICIAIARELAGFMWDLARQVSVQAA
jgi:transposase